MKTPSKIIRGIEGEAYDRWQMPVVDEPEEEVPAEELETAPGPTVRELEELQRAAYEEGFAEGRAAGLEQGQAEGFAQGQAEGLAAGEQEGRALAEQMRQIFDTLAEPIRQLDDAVEQALSQLAMTLAQQIIHHELTVQPEEILVVVREAVALLPLTAREVRVQLHPDDARLVREMLNGGDELSSWSLVEDAALSRGGCHVTSGNSHIDASLEQRIALLAAEALGASMPHPEEEEPA